MTEKSMTGQQAARQQLHAGHGTTWVSDHTGLTTAEVEAEAARAGLVRVPGTDRWHTPGAPTQPHPTARPRLAAVPDRQEPPMQPAQTLAQRAAATGDARVLALHAKAKEAQERLRAAVEAWEAKSEARQRIADLKQQLAEARAALKGGKPSPNGSAPATGDAKAVRAWAAANGVDCPRTGKVPNHVRHAYEEARR